MSYVGVHHVCQCVVWVNYIDLVSPSSGVGNRQHARRHFTAKRELLKLVRDTGGTNRKVSGTNLKVSGTTHIGVRDY